MNNLQQKQHVKIQQHAASLISIYTKDMLKEGLVLTAFKQREYTMVQVNDGQKEGSKTNSGL